MNIPGGIFESVDLPDDILNFLSSKLKNGYFILDIKNIKSQVVSGIMYYFDIKIINNSTNMVQIYKMSIWSHPWTNPKYEIQEIIPISR